MPNKTSKKPKITRKQRKAAANSSEDYSSVSTTNANTAVEYLENPVKSDADTNQYRVIKLDNGLTATLISCTNDSSPDCKTPPRGAYNGEKGDLDRTARTKKNETFEWFGTKMDNSQKQWAFCTCSLSINVGSFSDPEDAPYLSRLLSKTVLISSKKYPQNNGLCDFLRKNAFYSSKVVSDYEFTSFTFHVPVFHACDAIDRFTSCFVNPVLRREAVLREHENSEADEIHQQLQDELFAGARHRLFRKMALVSKNHPGYIFKKCSSVCTCKTGSELLQEANKFMNHHYSAHRMTLVLKGQVPLDSLEQCVKKYFTRIPSNGITPLHLASFNYDRCFDNREFNLLYVRDLPAKSKIEKIELDWIMPPTRRFYRVKPHQYISKLLQNQLPGSLLHYLQHKQWCSDVEIGVGSTDLENNSIYSIFKLSLTLTEEGIEHQKEILDVVHSYLNFLKLGGTQKRIYDEIREIEKALFRLNSDFNLTDFCEELSRNMHVFPSQHYLTGNFLYYDYDPKTITTCLDCMSPERVNIKLDSNHLTDLKHSLDTSESKNGFRRTKIPGEWINDWKKKSPLPCFELPESNPFCPDDFTLVPIPKNTPQHPVKIYSDSLCEIWHKLDDKYRGPVGLTKLYFASDVGIKSAENSVMLAFFCDFLKTILRDTLYLSTIVGMKYDFHIMPSGIVVHASGFSQILPLLMIRIATYIGDCSRLLTEEFLDVKKSLATRGYWAVCKSPDIQALDMMSSILQPTHWTKVDKLKAVSNITFEKFKYFVEHFTDHVYVQSLVEGNIGVSQTLDMVKLCLELSKCGPLEPNTKSLIETKRIPQLPRGSHCCKVQHLHPMLDVTHVLSYYQFGDKSVVISAGTTVLMMILQHPIFEIIRRRENIGHYGVEMFVDSFSMGYILSMKIHGINPTIELRIENYRRAVSKMLKQMSRSEWEIVKATYCKLEDQIDNILEEEMARHWSEIVWSQYNADRHVRDAEIISRLEIDDLKKLIISLTTDGLNTRKLSIQIVGHTEFTDIESKLRDNYIPPLNEVKIKLLTDESENQEEADYHYITDIAVFRSSLRTISMDSADNAVGGVYNSGRL